MYALHLVGPFDLGDETAYSIPTHITLVPPYELERVIRHEGKEPPERESLIRMLRAWENGEHRPDDLNRQRLAEVLGPILDEDVKIIQPDLTAASAPPSSPGAQDLRVRSLDR